MSIKWFQIKHESAASEKMSNEVGEIYWQEKLHDGNLCETGEMAFSMIVIRSLVHHITVSDIMKGKVVSALASLMIVYLTVYSGANQRKHTSSASLAFVRGNHRSPVNSSHKEPVMWNMSPFDDVIMKTDNNQNTLADILWLILQFYLTWNRPIFWMSRNVIRQFDCELILM